MNSILFIYIFSLFVITSPNFIFKIPVRSYWISIAIHAVIFSCILYFTYDIVNRDVVESAVVNNGSDQDDGTASVGGTGGTASGTASGNETIIIESTDSGTDSEGVKKNAANSLKLKEQHNQTVLDNANDLLNLAKTYVDNAAIYADTAYQAANQINGASTASPATHTTSGAATHTTSASPATHTSSGAATHTTSASPATPTPTTSEVTLWFKTSTGSGIQLSKITFYDANGIQLSVVSTEKPSTNNDDTHNQLTQNPSNLISNVIDGKESTKWWSWGTYGSVTFTVSGIPSSYTFTTGNDNNPHNRTPVTWTAYFNTHVNTENHTGETNYTSATQQNLFTLPADGTKFSLQGGSTTSGSTPTTTPITQANIQTAVNAWTSDPTTATATYGHISNWDTSGVTNMNELFVSKINFNNDISGWDVSNVTNMQSMFNQAHSFNIPIGNWDVSNVTTMYAMFQDAKAFNQSLNNWNVSRVNNMFQMFANARAFNQNLNNWSPVTSVNTGYMFFGVPGMNNSKVSSWSGTLTNPNNINSTYPQGLGMFG